MFVTGSSFDDLGRVTGRSMSTTTAGTVATFVRDYGYHAPTGLVDRLRAGWNDGTGTVWFADDTITRDTAGRVTQVVDAGVEPDGGPSAVKECFVYDHEHRLVRAHTASPATGCATFTTSTSVAPGSRDPYDTVWAFDDLQRITSRTNQMTAATTTYQYSGAGPHAVTGLTGATTATYSYNPAGEMVDRDGTTLVWDPLGRLTVNGTTTSVYGSGPDRLIHTAGSTRTLTLPGVDVVNQAGVRTVTRQITLAGTLVALAGGGQVWWNCASLSNTITCQTPAATTLAPPVPARKRFGPYGTARNGIVFAHTDRGYLGAPHDPTGLVHLQHRHLDPQLGTFIGVDRLVGTTRQPYLYANGNPTTLTDPTGLCAEQQLLGGCLPNPRARDGGERGSAGKVCWADAGQQFCPVVDLSNGTTTGLHDRWRRDWKRTEWERVAFFQATAAADGALTTEAFEIATNPDTTRYWLDNLDDWDTWGRLAKQGQKMMLDTQLVASIRLYIRFASTVRATHTARAITRPAGIADDWVSEVAANGKGTVWRAPGTSGNAGTVRIMEPTAQYPNGYVRFYNQHGQPIGLNGNPGPSSVTHIPLNPDGTYVLPKGWGGAG